MSDPIVSPNAESDNLKRCTKCGFECSVEDVEQFFYRRYQGKPGGFQSRCKVCMRANYREKRSKDPDTFRNYGRKSYYKNRETRLASIREKREADPERWRDAKRRFMERHPDKARAISKRSYEKHKEKRLAKQREYGRAHRHVKAMQCARRRAKINELPIDWTREDRWSAVEYFNYTCAYCGSQFQDLFGDVVIHFDHYIPVSAGGGTTFDNMLPTCNTCNLSKSSLDPVFWLTRKFGKRKANKIQKRIMEYFEGFSRGN